MFIFSFIESNDVVYLFKKIDPSGVSGMWLSTTLPPPRVGVANGSRGIDDNSEGADGSEATDNESGEVWPGPVEPILNAIELEAVLGVKVDQHKNFVIDTVVEEGGV